MTNRGLFLSLGVLAPLVCAVALVAQSSSTGHPAPVHIAHQNNFPPFIYVKDGKSVGLLVDLLKAAAEREGIEIVFVSVPFAQVHGTLTDGRAEAIVPLAITPERQESYDFSAPLVTTGGALFVRAPNPTPPSLAALSGKTVVTPKTGPFAAYIRKTAPDVKLVTTADYEQSFKRVISGEADAAALNLQVGASMVAQSYAGKVTVPKEMFSELPLAVAVTKGQHAELLKQLDAGLAAIRADGTWQRINDHWAAQ
ncbi:MAG: transporter substrate-binding domain-containing protein [Acidobacteriaceae bacterium]